MKFEIEKDVNYEKTLGFAIILIRQLPETHDGRNTFIMNYSKCREGAALRVKHIMQRNISEVEKINLITELFDLNEYTQKAEGEK